jgi:hypothetical protein
MDVDMLITTSGAALVALPFVALFLGVAFLLIDRGGADRARKAPTRR